MAMLTMRIDDELNARITALAQKTGRTKTYFIKKLLVEAIDDLEDELWAQEAITEYRARIASGEKEEWFDFATVMKELDERDLAIELEQASNKESVPNAEKRENSGSARTGKSDSSKRSGKAGQAA
jgi:RHH-type rel operon transcriptional repressor/antitoxin RelB